MTTCERWSDAIDGVYVAHFDAVGARRSKGTCDAALGLSGYDKGPATHATTGPAVYGHGVGASALHLARRHEMLVEAGELHTASDVTGDGAHAPWTR